MTIKGIEEVGEIDLLELRTAAGFIRKMLEADAEKAIMQIVENICKAEDRKAARLSFERDLLPILQIMDQDHLNDFQLGATFVYQNESICDEGRLLARYIMDFATN